MMQAYLFMGCAGSGRADVLTDLASWCSQDGSVAAVVADGDDLNLKEIPTAQWRLEGGKVIVGTLPANTDVLFFVLNGKGDPSDQMEALSSWFKDNSQIELARIITILNSRLLSERPAFASWFEACVHFSDVVLFSNREGVTNKWFSDYRKSFQSKCFPCVFEFVKNGKVGNPAEILYPEARRMSLAFELEEEAGSPDVDFDVGDIPIIDETEGEEVDADDAETDLSSGIDPYFERDAAGRRRIRLPDISAAC